MRTRHISSDQWKAFFNDFTQLHRGKRVNVETLDGGEWGVQSNLCDRELVGIVAMPLQPGEGESDEWIEVIVREGAGSNASHTIGQPDQVSVADENGRTIALQIHAANGSITMIRFQPSVQNMPEGFMVA